MQQQTIRKGCMPLFERYFVQLGSAILVAMLLVAPAHAQLNFNFTYTDFPGVGFNAADPLGLARRTAMAETATLLAGSFPTLSATINMDVDGSETTDGTLAAAGSNFTSAAAVVCLAGYDRGDVGIVALGGVDPSAGVADGIVTVNFEDIVWDLDDSVSPGSFDFKSTIMHELLHALGFANSITETGTDPCGKAEPIPGGWVPYDEHLGDSSTNFIDSLFVINTSAWLVAVIGGTGTAGTLWHGANGVAANGGNPIPLYSPTTYSGGSSIAHLDDDFFTGTPYLMESATGPGPGIRTLSPFEVGIMRDIGYNNTTPVELQSFTID